MIRKKKKAGFESITEQIATSSTAGKLIFDVFTSLSDNVERNLIRERTRAGLDAARARGRLDGRKPKLDDKQCREIRALLKDPNIKYFRCCQATLGKPYYYL